MSGKRHTVAELIRFLKQFPPDSTVWGYTGEVSGIIVSHKTMSGLAHNDGTLEVKDRSRARGVSDDQANPSGTVPSGTV